MDIITEEQLENWLGSDNGRDNCIDILLDLLNGDYQLPQMRQDILETFLSVRGE